MEIPERLKRRLSLYNQELIYIYNQEMEWFDIFFRGKKYKVKITLETITDVWFNQENYFEEYVQLIIEQLKIEDGFNVTD